MRQGFVPGGLKNNRDFAECLVTYANDVPQELRTILYDPQTAGGLLVSLPADKGMALEAEFARADLFLARIGEVTEGAGVTLS